MGVLDVEDRVVHALLGDLFEVEGLTAVDRLHEVGEASGVGTDLGDDVVERDEITRPTAHLHFFPTAGEVDHLGDGDLEFVGIVAEQLHRRLHAGDIAVVVGTPDVEEEFGAGELVTVIGDVGREVGEITVALDEDAILVVAELGRAKPHCAVILEDRVVGSKVVHCIVDGASRNERPLAEPDLMVDVERFERGPMRVEAALETPFERVGVGRHLTSPRMDVRAVVAVLRDRLIGLRSGERLGVVGHLHAAVIDVGLTGDTKTASFLETGDRVAVAGAATMPGVQRLVRVGRDELDVEVGSGTEIR